MLSSGFLGFLLGLGLDGWLRRRGESTGERGFVDELLWGIPLPGGTAVLNTDGSFSCGWALACPDFSSTTDAQMIEIGRGVNEALMPLVDRWLVNWDTFRVPASEYSEVQDFPDPVSRLLDRERALRFGSLDNYVTQQVLVVTYTPPRDLYDRYGDLFVKTAGPTSHTSWQEHVDKFEQAANRLQTELGRTFRLKRLGVSELASHYRMCLTGIVQPVGVPEGSCLRDLVVAEEFVGGFEPRFGDRYLALIAVRGYPTTPSPDALEVFHTFPFRCRSSARIYPLGRRAGSRLVKRARQGWFNRTIQPSEKRARLFQDSHALSMARDASDALSVIETGATAYSTFTWTLVLSSRSRKSLEERCSHVVEGLACRGLVASVERVNAVAAFLGSLPGHGQHNLRRSALSVRAIAEMLPTTAPNLGAESCPSSLYPAGSPPVLWGLTEGSSPYRLHLAYLDIAHGLIVGGTRSGKSVLVELLMLQALRWQDSQVVVFDVGYSSAFPAIAAGGVHHDIGSDAAVDLQPLAELDTAEERQWAISWLIDILKVQKVEATPALQRDLEAAIDLLHREERSERTLSLLSRFVQEDRVRGALEPYTTTGRYGRLLDSNCDGLAENRGRLQVFEISHLLSSRDEQITLPVLLYLFRRVERRLDRGVPTHLILEEASEALRHPVFADRIGRWLRRLAKANCGVWLVDQSVEAILALPCHKAILDACQSRILLPDPHALEAGSQEIYAHLGLNRKVLEMLAHARSQRDYLHSTPDGSRLFQLDLGPFARLLLTPEPGKTVLDMYRRALVMREKYGDQWFARYLRERDRGDAAKELEWLFRQERAERAA